MEIKQSLTMQNTAETAFVANVHKVISAYKADFEHINENERYKWEGIGWFKKHWDIEAEDFATMLSSAFSKMSTLLASAMYYPYKMLTAYANEEPEAVRGLFRMLYDESLPLVQRYVAFRESFDNYMEKMNNESGGTNKPLHHFQDLRAVMVYLTCRYPEKYYLFKSTMYTAFRDRTAYMEVKPKQKSAVWKVESYQRMCEVILEEVQKDAELIAMSRARLDENCYQDDALHLLTMDIVYYGGVCMTEPSIVNLSASDYWPSLDEYDPGITTEMWIKILQDGELTTADNLDMLRKMLELGGESTCAHLAEVYGNTHNHYNKLGSSFGERVKKKFNCPDCVDTENEIDPRDRVYVIPFVGSPVIENGKKRYSWKLRDELKEALMYINTQTPPMAEESVTDVGLNTILYGPPGTGKTYHTVIYAVAIIENKPLAEVEAEDYSDVWERYHTYKEQGKIAFTTFHQSLGYEEFIEGIKPIVDLDGEAGDIQYSVQPGIFKRFCETAVCPAASLSNMDLGLNENPTIWKVSLEKTGVNPTRMECMKNGHIRIGWDEYGKDITDETNFSAGGKSVLNAFINRMQIGDIVLSCYSASIIDAIGVVTGEYEWHDEYQHYKRLRKVKWLVKDIQENILTMNGGIAMTLASVYRMANITLENVFVILQKHMQIPVSKKNENYVFIIDEINRGNISKIFGELITLIEPSKRLGQSESMETVLPYSQKPFGVPGNVYIIGTMNTADRSIAAIDTALRRRFQFREILPDAGVLANVSVEDLSVSDMLKQMNQKITVLFDREHTIGHAYFMPLMNNPTVETLAEIFENNIIPLLQEYFYDDYEKIRLVLGDNRKSNTEEQFIIAKSNNYTELFGDTDVGLDDGFSYEINKAAFGIIEAYRSI